MLRKRKNTKEDHFIGVKFRHRSHKQITYTINKSDSKDCFRIEWNNNEGNKSSDYNKDQVIFYFKQKIWIKV